MKRYRAPWSVSVIVVSTLTTILCLSISLSHWKELAALRVGTIQFWSFLFPLALVIGAALFTVRGYSLGPDVILVHRLLWATRLPRKGLQSARFEPEAMRGSIRLFGNGGFFSASGLFRSPALGRYRAFVTDQRRAVVLRYPNRTIVVSPGAPEDFVHELSSAEGIA